MSSFILTDKWFKAIVVKGQGRGKKIGFPTINLKSSKPFPVKTGVYSCQLRVDKRNYFGLLHFGRRPTFKNKKKTIEVYLPDQQLTVLAGKEVEFQLLSFLRPVKKFINRQSLVEQIKKDIQQARTKVEEKRFLKV